jgi:hypothetical protein
MIRAAQLHSVAWWTGAIGALVTLLNAVLGLNIPTQQVIAFATIIAGMVLGTSHVAHGAAIASAGVGTKMTETSSAAPGPRAEK